MKNSVYDIVTDAILAQIEQGVIPWHKPWATVKPYNFKTGKEYRGVNPILLSGATDPRFLTFNQAKELGGNVKKGAKSHIVVFWSPLSVKTVKDEESGEELVDSKSLGKFVLKYYRVFCASDIEGIDFGPLPVPVKEFNPIDAAEQVWNDYKNRPAFVMGGNKACYYPSRDQIQMPLKEVFESPEEYYSTLFHEMGHSTGHPTRLNRKGIAEFNGFGTHTYSYEELVAEMTAAFLCTHVGIENTIQNSASYIKGWASKLKEDTKMIVLAASQAQKASDLILGVNKGGAE